MADAVRSSAFPPANIDSDDDDEAIFAVDTASLEPSALSPAAWARQPVALTTHAGYKGAPSSATASLNSTQHPLPQRPQPQRPQAIRAVPSAGSRPASQESNLDFSANVQSVPQAVVRTAISSLRSELSMRPTPSLRTTPSFRAAPSHRPAPTADALGALDRKSTSALRPLQSARPVGSLRTAKSMKHISSNRSNYGSKDHVAQSPQPGQSPSSVLSAVPIASLPRGISTKPTATQKKYQHTSPHALLSLSNKDEESGRSAAFFTATPSQSTQGTESEPASIHAPLAMDRITLPVAPSLVISERQAGKGNSRLSQALSDKFGRRQSGIRPRQTSFGMPRRNSQHQHPQQQPVLQQKTRSFREIRAAPLPVGDSKPNASTLDLAHIPGNAGRFEDMSPLTPGRVTRESDQGSRARSIASKSLRSAASPKHKIGRWSHPASVPESSRSGYVCSRGQTPRNGTTDRDNFKGPLDVPSASSKKSVSRGHLKKRLEALSPKLRKLTGNTRVPPD